MRGCAVSWFCMGQRFGFGVFAFYFVVIINKIYDKKAYYKKILPLQAFVGFARAFVVSFVFVVFAFAPCSAFLGLLRGCVGAWCKNGNVQFAQILHFDKSRFWVYNIRGSEQRKTAPHGRQLGRFTMSFEQTKIFHDLVNNFTRFANEYRHDTRREQLAADMIQRSARMHGLDRIAKVAKKANQKAKVKFYSV